MESDRTASAKIIRSKRAARRRTPTYRQTEKDAETERQVGGQTYIQRKERTGEGCRHYKMK